MKRCLRGELITEEMTITPQMAEKMLSKNKKNRPVCKAWVNHLASEMSKNRWKLNYHTIKIADNGMILDGQHRLYAVVKSGVSIISLVVYNVNPNVFDTLDLCHVRSGADALSIDGEQYCTLLQSALRWVYRYEEKLLSSTDRVKLSPIELKEMLQKHPDIRLSAVVGKKHYKAMGKIMSAAGVTFLHYIFHDISEQHCQSFFDKLVTGANLEEKSPILFFRDYLIANRSAVQKYPLIHQLAMGIKAWNFFRQGRRMKHFRWGKGASFPKAI